MTKDQALEFVRRLAAGDTYDLSTAPMELLRVKGLVRFTDDDGTSYELTEIGETSIASVIVPLLMYGEGEHHGPASRQEPS
jgi:hypothetical protein